MATKSSGLLNKILEHFSSIRKGLMIVIPSVAALLAGCTTAAEKGQLMTREELQRLWKENDLVSAVYNETDDPNIIRVTLMEARSELWEVEQELKGIAINIEWDKKSFERSVQDPEILGLYIFRAREVGKKLVPHDLFLDVEKRLSKLEEKHPGAIQKLIDRLIELKGEHEQLMAEIYVFNAMRPLENAIEKVQKGERVRMPNWEDLEKEINKGIALRKFLSYLNEFEALKKIAMDLYKKNPELFELHPSYKFKFEKER